MAQNLKVNDTVQIISGSHKGKTGQIVHMDRANHRAMIADINVRERHVRANQLNPKGSKKTVHLGIDLSNLKLTEPAKQPAKSTKSTKSTKKGDK